MAVSTAYAPISYNGNGATTAFSVTWPFFTGSLVVTLVDDDGVETAKTITTHYTVSGGTDGNGLPATGTVTMLTAPASGEQLRIERSTTKTQTSTWTNGGSFHPKTLEATLDKLMLVHQEAAAAVSDALDGITGDLMRLNSAGADDYWDAEDHKIRNVTDGTEDDDAVTKAQLDAVAVEAGAVGGTYFVQSGTGAVERAWQSKMRETVSVLDFIPVAMHGNIIAGTSTDDVTEYLEDAITAAGTGGALYFPKGLYIFSSVLTQLSGQKWHGAGRDATILRLDDAVTDIDVLISASDFAEDYSIEDMQIDGNRENITPGVDLYNNFNMIIGPRGGKRGTYRNLLLANSWGRALQTSNGSVSEYAEDILVDGVLVANAGTKAISATKSKRVTITGCFAEVDPYTSADHPGGVGDGNATSGSCFECADAHDVSLFGNHGNQIGASLAAPGIRLINGSRSIRAFGNTIKAASNLAFIQSVSDIDFFGNLGRDIRGNAIYIQDAEGEAAANTCKRVRVHHNTIIDPDATYVLVNGNKSTGVEIEAYVYENDFVQISGSPTHGIYHGGLIAPAVSGTISLYQWGNRFTGTIPNQLAGPAASEIQPEPREQYRATSTTATTPAVIARNTTDAATVCGLQIEGDRATPANSDNIGLRYVLSDSAGNQDEILRLQGRITDVTSGSEHGALDIQIMSSGTLTNRYYLDSTTFRPATAGAINLGAASFPFGSLFLEASGVLNFNNGDVTLTHSTNALAFAGGSSGYSFDALVTASVAGNAGRFVNTTDAGTVEAIRIEGDRATPTANDRVHASFYMSDSAGNQDEYARIIAFAASVTSGAEDGRLEFATMTSGSMTTRLQLNSGSLRPVTNDAIALGAATLSFADLFLASGGVINWNNGNVVLTHNNSGMISVTTGAFGRGAPVTKAADFTLGASENWVINNKSGSACVATLPAASSWTGREVMMKTIQAQAINSASSNVVPLAGGAAGTAIVTGTAGNWATLVSDGTNWIIVQAGP